MNLREYAQVFRRNWLWIAAAGVFGIIISTCATLLIPQEYTARTTLYVASDAPPDNALASYQAGLLSEQRVKSYAVLVRSDRVSRSVTDKLGLRITPQQLAQKISASVQDELVLIDISVEDPSPETAVRLANGVSEASIQLMAQLDSSTNVTGALSVRAQMVGPATLDLVSPIRRPTINTALGLTIGVLVGAALALARSALDATVKSLNGVSELSGITSLGSVPRDVSFERTPLLSVAEPQSAVAEAFKHIRTNLQFVDVDSPPKVLTISSPLAGDGKTTVAVNLATTLSSAGFRVMLVDADLRRPKAEEYLGLNADVGLTTLLTGKASISSVVQVWRDERVHVIASGPLPPNPSELLGSNLFASILRNLREQYDYVLIDAPPLLPVTDAAACAPRSDGVLLILRYGKTTTTQVHAARTAIEAVSSQVIGCILTQTPRRAVDAYVSNYYGPKPIQSVQIARDQELVQGTQYTNSEIGDSGQSRPSPVPRADGPGAEPVTRPARVSPARPTRSYSTQDGRARRT